jgi:hypothetical protein
MIAHEPKFLSENLIIFPKVGKGAGIHSSFRGHMRRWLKKSFKIFAFV